MTPFATAGNGPNECSPWDSRWLWSLWDMLKFNASAFYLATTRLTETAAYLDAVGDDVDSAFHAERKLDDIDRDYLLPKLEEVTMHVALLGARVTGLTALELKGLIGQPYATWGDVKQRTTELNNILIRELKLVTLLALNADEQKYFDPNEPHFGQEVSAKFQSAAYEIDEAGKCLALGRPTACVFHLMRTMEIGVRALARCLAIPDPLKPAERSWGAVLEKIWRDGIEKKWPTTTSRMHGDGHLFEALYASFDAVKNPWRNATMHVEIKYTDDEAEHVFVAVKGFMKKLASRLDENGDPKA